MKLIIGLGNPGKRYEKTRHNIGAMIIESLQKHWGFPDFKNSAKFSARLSENIWDGEKVILVQPQTYMNLSGTSIQTLLHFYRLTPHDILIIHDDLDLPFGSTRIATDSSAAGHNGVQSIINALGTQTFKRVRLGIGRPENQEILPSNYVLQPFSQDELTAIENDLPSITRLIEQELVK